MTLLNGISCSVVSVTLSAVAFCTVLNISKNVLPKETQDKALKVANVIILTSGIMGYYHGYYSKGIFGK